MTRNISAHVLSILIVMSVAGSVHAQLEPFAVSYVFGEGACRNPEFPEAPGGILVSTFTSTGVGCHAGEGHISRLWTNSDSVDVSQYMGFKIAALNEEVLSFTESDSLYISAYTGTGIRIQPLYIVDGVSHVLGDTLLTAQIPPPAFSFALGESFSADSIEFRIYGYDNNSSAGAIAITEVVLTLRASNVRVSSEQDLLTHQVLTTHVFPNPARNKAVIAFDAPASGPARLRVYDMQGRESGTLLNGWVSSGYHRIEWNLEGISGGLYAYRLQLGDQVVSGKLVVLK